MFDKIYKAYLDLNQNTSKHIILVIQDGMVLLTIDMDNLLYVGHMSDSKWVYDNIRLCETLHPDWFAGFS